MRINFTISGTKYSLDADGSQYTLIRHGVNSKEGDNLGKPTETQIGYYSQVNHALNRAVKDELGSQPDEIDLKEFLSRYESAMESISNQIGGK
jgi:hypothetical protein